MKANLQKIVLPLFVLLGLILGGRSIAQTPTFDVYDAAMHYYNTYALATGQAFLSKKSVSLGYGYRYYIEGEADLRVKREWLAPSDVKSPTTVMWVRAQYPPCNWLPQALGLKLGMLAEQTPETAQTWARVTNLLVYLVLLTLAMYWLKDGRARLLLAVIVLSPQALYLGASLSADSINMAWSVLYVAYMLRCLTSKKMLKVQQLVLLGFLGLVLFWLKIAYTPLWLLVLAFDKTVLPPLKKYLLFLGVSGIGASTYLVWQHFYGISLVTRVSKNNALLVQQQPLHALTAILSDMEHLPFWLWGNQGIDFSSTGTNKVALILTALALIIFIFSPKRLPRGLKDFFVSYRLQLLGLLSALTVMLAIFVNLLLTWDNLQLGWVQLSGFQARYLLPLLPLLILVFYLPKKQHSKGKMV